MKNNIKKAPVKFGEDLLYFQHFMQIFVFCSKLVIITTLRNESCGLLINSNCSLKSLLVNIKLFSREIKET